MVRLIGEVAALPGGHAEKKRYLMEGLCRLIDADAWAWGLSCRHAPNKPQVYVSLVKGGFSEESFAKWLQALEHPEIVELASDFFIELQNKKVHLTRLRDQFIDSAGFERSKARPIWQEADVGPMILSQRPLDKTSSSTIGLYRRFDRPMFSPRDSRIAHIVLTEVPWLHEQGWPEDRGAQVPALSKRQRLTLNLLTLGQSHKQIASHMNISKYTVQGYIKQVYRHFGVSSQAELMSRFFQGDGQDTVI